MKKYIILFLLMSGIFSLASAQNDTAYKYDRGSLCMIMIEHPNYAFNKEIAYVFSKMDIPKRFNDHNLGVHIVRFAEDKYHKDQIENIKSFTKQVNLGNKFVAKWFNRNKKTGCFNMDLIKERGNYNATIIDVNLAKSQTRKLSILEDAGENLISHTYLVMHDITYINKADRMQTISNVLAVTSMVAQSVYTIKGDDEMAASLGDLSNATQDILENIKGFRVKVTSYLFRLNWNDTIAQEFYSQMYTESPNDNNKIEKFKNSDLFKLEYVGSVTNTSSTTSFYGIKTGEEMITKVCTRALDKNIADLQHEFADFRIKAPLISTSPIQAYIGMKEDINANSRYEVLEKVTDTDGNISYKTVGVIKPIKDKIWDNRCMASLENTDESKLKATEFKQVSGGTLLPGMLIREIK